MKKSSMNSFCWMFSMLYYLYSHQLYQKFKMTLTFIVLEFHNNQVLLHRKLFVIEFPHQLVDNRELFAIESPPEDVDNRGFFVLESPPNRLHNRKILPNGLDFCGQEVLIIYVHSCGIIVENYLNFFSHEFYFLQVHHLAFYTYMSPTNFDRFYVFPIELYLILLGDEIRILSVHLVDILILDDPEVDMDPSYRLLPFNRSNPNYVLAACRIKTTARASCIFDHDQQCAPNNSTWVSRASAYVQAIESQFALMHYMTCGACRTFIVEIQSQMIVTDVIVKEAL